MTHKQTRRMKRVEPGHCLRCWVIHRLRTKDTGMRWQICSKCEAEIDAANKRATEPGGIDDLPLSVRALNCLNRIGVGTIAELRQLSEDQLLATQNLGNKTVREIAEVLREYIVDLPIQPEEWGHAA